MKFRELLLEFRGMPETAPQSLAQAFGLRSGKPNREFEIALKHAAFVAVAVGLGVPQDCQRLPRSAPHTAKSRT